MSIEDIINDVIRAEDSTGKGVVTNNPNDKGGRTQYGISEKSNPQAWSDGKVTEDEARIIYYNKYVKGPGFDQIIDSNLQAQLVDFGVNSGPFIAISKLQLAIGAEVDGVLGPETLAKIDDHTNNKLACQRVLMIGKIIHKNPSQLEFINGWLNRAVSFIR